MSLKSPPLSKKTNNKTASQATTPRPADSPQAVEQAGQTGPAVASEHGSDSNVDVDADVNEVDAELLEVFREEGRDLLEQIGQGLQQLQTAAHDRALIRHVLQPLHTLKGSARMAGAIDLSRHMHELENRIAGIVSEGKPSALQMDDLLAQHERSLQLFQTWQGDQLRPARELPQELMPVLEQRLQLLTRQMASETGKPIALEMVGTGVALQRAMLQKLMAPLEHLLRNAAVHGIETSAQRRAAGKDAVGRLLLEIHQEDHEITLRFSDDGQGLDLARIRDQALSLGLIKATQQLSDAQLSSLIFQAGLSTCDELSASAGRGIGMDVVWSEVAALGGHISIESVVGQGVAFLIRLPLPPAPGC